MTPPPSPYPRSPAAWAQLTAAWDDWHLGDTSNATDTPAGRRLLLLLNAWLSAPGPTISGMTDTPADQGQAPLYTSETPSHVPTWTPTEPNVVKRTEETSTTTTYGDADADDDADV